MKIKRTVILTCLLMISLGSIAQQVRFYDPRTLTRLNSRQLDSVISMADLDYQKASGKKDTAFLNALLNKYFLAERRYGQKKARNGFLADTLSIRKMAFAVSERGDLNLRVYLCLCDKLQQFGCYNLVLDLLKPSINAILRGQNAAQDSRSTEDNLNRALLCQYLARALKEMRSYGEAQTFYRRACDLFAVTSGTESTGYALVLSELAEVAVTLKNCKEAEHSLDIAYPILVDKTGYASCETLALLCRKAACSEICGPAEGGKQMIYQLAGDYWDIVGSKREVPAETLQSMGMAAYYAGVADTARYFLNLASQAYSKSGRTSDAWASTLVILSLLDLQKNGRSQFADAELVETYEMAQRLFVRNSPSLDEQEVRNYKFFLPNLRDMILSRFSGHPDAGMLESAFNGDLFSRAILLKVARKEQLSGPSGNLLGQLRAELGPGEAAVDFVYYHHWHGDTSQNPCYGALLLTHGATRPIFLKLFSEDELKSLIIEPGGNLRSAYQLYGSKGLEHIPERIPQLKALLWNKLENYLTACHTIYYTMDGLLTAISLPAVLADQRGLDGRALNLIACINLSDLAAIKREMTYQPLSFGLVGNINYDTIQFKGSGAQKFTHLLDQITLRLNDSLKTDKVLHKTVYPPLGDSTEITGTAKSVRLSPNRQIRWVLQGEDFTENNFKQKAVTEAPDAMLISTHGYYAPRYDRSRIPDYNYTKYGIYALSEDPLERSGLALSHANQQIMDADYQGMMLAKDVAGLNLSGTKLVVLSACETAKGEVVYGEGAFGLPRAFKIAGVKYVVSSLYSINEEEANTFMTFFFTGLLRGEPIVRAFQAAQIKTRNNLDISASWASWVMLR
jgi:hypothetical protein